MTRHYPDLGRASDWLNQISHAARPIRSPTKIWVVTRHQYGISALVSQTSFGGETSGSVAKCRLFSQATGHLLSRGFWIANFPTNQKSGFQNKNTSGTQVRKVPPGLSLFSSILCLRWFCLWNSVPMTTKLNCNTVFIDSVFYRLRP